MANKQLMPNQCDVLHPIYGVHDCCLCNERATSKLLKEDLEWLIKVCVHDKQESSYYRQRINLIKTRWNLNQGV